MAWEHLLAEYPVTIALPVQWGDQDSFAHVNNTLYFRWFESARIAYCLRIGLATSAASRGIGPILASISCNFRRPVTFPDTVHIGSRIVKIGRTSLTMEHAVASEAQAGLMADGSSVLVVYDYDGQKSHPVPDAVRTAIAELEGKPF